MAGSLALPSLLQRVILDTRGLNQGASEVEQRLTRTGASATALERRLQSTGRTGRIATLALAGGALAVGAALERAVHHAAEYAAGVRRIQQFTGGTAEESSKLAFVLGRVGISTDTGARAIGLFSRNLENGSKNLTKYFTAAQLARFQSQGLIKTIPELAAKYQSLGNATERNAFLLNVFGRGGTQIRRLLELTKGDFTAITAEASKFGLVLTQQNITAFRKFSESEREVGQALKGLEVQVGNAVIPAFESAAHAVTLALTEFEKLPGPVKSGVADLLLAASAVTLLASGARFLGPGFTIAAGGLGLLNRALVFTIPGLGALEAEMSLLPTRIGLAALSLKAFATQEVGAAFAGDALSVALAGVAVAGAGLAGFAIGTAIQRNIIAPAIAAKESQHDLHAQTNANIAVFRQLAAAGKISGTALHEIVGTFQRLKNEGKFTAEVQGRIFTAEGIARIRATAEAGGNLAGVIREIGGVTNAQATKLREAAQATDAFRASILGSIAVAAEQKTATDIINSTVDKFGVSSSQTAIAIQNYVDAVTNSTAADNGANDATSELGKARAAATAQGVQLAEQEGEAAKKRQEDEQTAADNVITATQKVQDAKQHLADTQADAARSIRDADQSVADAEKSLADAQDRERDAQVALTDARRDAARALEDLTFRVEENSITQERNQLRVTDARKALADARKEGDPEKVKNAELDLKEALLQQREQTVQAKRDQEELNKRRKEGIAGSPEVIAAEKALAGAHDAVTQAVRASGKAVEEAALARHRASEQITSATRDVTTAQHDLARANDELAQSIRDLAAALALINAVNAGVASTVGPAIGGAIGGILHEGGIVMHKGGQVPRMHVGGLRPDERHIIAQAGEFMFRRESVRSIGAARLAEANRTGRLPSGRDPAMLSLLAEIRDALAAGRGDGNTFNITERQDARVLARELAYTFGRGR